MTVELTQFYLEHQLKDWTESERAMWLDIIEHAFATEPHLQGYRDGVLLVRLPGAFLKHTTVTLVKDEVIQASFSSRVDGEFPRKRLYVERTVDQLPWAQSVFAVFYAREVLAEDGDLISAPWGVVTHLTSSMDLPEPMAPDTLLANHFKLDGGTSTQMSAAEFERQLAESLHFWKDKVSALVINMQE